MAHVVPCSAGRRRSRSRAAVALDNVLARSPRAVPRVDSLILTAAPWGAYRAAPFGEVVVSVERADAGMVSRDGNRAESAPRAHITLVRPPAISSRFSYTIGVVLPLGPAYLAGALLEAGHLVAAVDGLGEAPFQRGPTSQPHLIYHGLSIPEIVERIDPATDAIAVSVMFSQQWPHVDELVRAIHARFPHRPIFVGGEHVTGAWQFVLDTCPPVTACALGE